MHLEKQLRQNSFFVTLLRTMECIRGAAEHLSYFPARCLT